MAKKPERKPDDKGFGDLNGIWTDKASAGCFSPAEALPGEWREAEALPGVKPETRPPSMHVADQIDPAADEDHGRDRPENNHWHRFLHG